MIKQTIAIFSISCLCLHAENPVDPTPEDPLATHEKGSLEVAEEQDELSADVQQLVIEQTDAKVIALLAEVENIMDETTEMLMEPDTGGKTIAAQTEIIEKIHAAAKQKQKSKGKGEGKPGSAMMDMMERMMGKKPGNQPGNQPGKEPGDQAGQGQEGDSDSGNDATNGGTGMDTSKARRVPKAAGLSGSSIPPEFQKALDAYNRGAEKKIK